MVDCGAPGLLPTCRAHSHKDQAQTCQEAKASPAPTPSCRRRGGQRDSGPPQQIADAEDTARAPRSSSQTPQGPLGPAVTPLALRSRPLLAVPRPPPAPLSRLQVAASSRKASPKLHPSPGGWRPFNPGQQLPTSCPSPQISPEPSPTSCLKEAADSVTSLLSSPEPSGPGHSLARTRRLGRTEPSGLGSDLGTGLQLAPSSAGATLISDTWPPTGTPLKDRILGWAGDQSLSTETHVGVIPPSHHAHKGSHAPHTPAP